MSHITRALVALVLVAGVAAQARPVRADAIADQKKAYKALGIAPRSVGGKCTIFTQSDAERVLHAPVVKVENKMDKTDCAYGLAKDPSVGVNVSREPRSDWYPPKPDTLAVSKLRHVPGVGENAYTYYANAGAGGVYSAEVLTAKGVTSVTLAEAAGNAATALAIARMVMNR